MSTANDRYGVSHNVRTLVNISFIPSLTLLPYLGKYILSHLQGDFSGIIYHKQLSYTGMNARFNYTLCRMQGGLLHEPDTFRPVFPTLASSSQISTVNNYKLYCPKIYHTSYLLLGKVTLLPTTST